MALLGAMEVLLTYSLYMLIPWILYVFTYRIAFHPLRKYPGPVFAKVTDAYAGIQAARRNPHLNIYKNIQKYGDVYRAGPDRLVFQSLAALEDIYTNPQITKSYAYRHARWMDKPNVFDTPDKQEHRRKRQAIGQVVSDKSLRIFEPTMIAQIDIFLRQLLHYTKKNEIVNMTPACKHLAADVVGFLSFGYALNTQTEATNRLITEAMNKAIFMVNIFMNWPALGIIGPVLRWIGRKKANTFYYMVQKMISARMSEPKDARADFYSIAIGDDHIDQEGLYDSELWTEALFFVLAGGTTVATAICSVFFHLVRHPTAYNRLTSEIRQCFTSGGDIRSGQKLASCIYLRAVIDEALRMSPPSLTPLWREPEPSSKAPFIVDGHVIPRGTQVSVHLYSILHDPRYYPDPFSFKPERWLEAEHGGSPDDEKQRNIRATMRRAQVGFGLGDRNCAGKSMAYMETSLVVAKTLWYFDCISAPGEAGNLGAGRRGSNEPWLQPDQFQIQDILIAEHDGPNLVFKPRGDYWQELDVSKE